MSRFSEWFKGLSMEEKKKCIPPGCHGANGENCEKYFEQLTVADQEEMKCKWAERNKVKAAPIPLEHPRPVNVNTPAIVQPVKLEAVDAPRVPTAIERETESIVSELMNAPVQVPAAAPEPQPLPELSPAEEPRTTAEAAEATNDDMAVLDTFNVKTPLKVLRTFIQNHNLDIKTTARSRSDIIADIKAKLGA